MVVAAFPLDAWLTVLGRLHPVFVHFPIALAVAAALVECWRAIRRDQALSAFALVAIWFAAIASLATAASGWCSAEYESHPSSGTLFLHRWLGVGSAVVLLALAVGGGVIQQRRLGGRVGLWRMTLIAAAGAVSLTGHFGGSMVYGDSYLADAVWAALDQTERAQRDDAVRAAKERLGIASAPEVVLASGESAPVVVAHGDAVIDFDSQIVPILKSRCYECHGNGKKKGGVRLDDYDRMTAERAGEWVVKPGDVLASLMVNYIELPADDEGAMPPEGDRVPQGEIALIRQWISQGAPRGATTSPGALSDSGWSIPERSLTQDELARIQAETRVLAKRGISVAPVAAGSSSFEVDASRATPPVTANDLERITSLAEFLVILNLAHGEFGDLVGGSFLQLNHLRALRLDHTEAGDNVAAAVATLPNLRSINFVATPLTDRGLDSLRNLKSLQKLYLWSSATTSAGVDRFRVSRPEVQVIDGRE